MALGQALVTLVVMTLCVGGLVVLWFWVLRQRGSGGARCGGCGYAVEGLQALQCPECGGDFRKVGIAPAASRLVHPVVFLLLWTVLLAPLAMVVSTLAMTQVPRPQRLRLMMSFQPASGSFPQVGIHLAYRGSSRTRPQLGPGGISTQSTGAGPDRRQTTTITFPRVTGGSVPLTVAELRLPQPGATTVQLTPGSVPPGPVFALPKAGGSIDEEALAAWLRASSAPTGGGEVDADAFAQDVAELAGLASAMLGEQPSYILNRLYSGGSSSGSGRASLPWWAIAAAVVFWAVVYAGGIAVFLAVRRKRLQAAPES